MLSEFKEMLNKDVCVVSIFSTWVKKFVEVIVSKRKFDVILDVVSAWMKIFLVFNN